MGKPGILEEQPLTPPVPPPRNFLSEKLGKSWSGGRPSTIEGQEYILDYMNQYGVAPTPLQVAQYKSGLGPEQVFRYAPGSVMADLGFKTSAEYGKAQQVGETFGVHVGEGYGRDVPMGGIVTTDEFGNPTMRYMDTSQGYAQRDIGLGRYITPPGGLEGAPRGFGEGFDPLSPERIDPSQYYRQPAPAYKPTMEGALGSFAPVQVYKSRLVDYVSAQAEQDAPEIQRLLTEIEVRKQELDDMLRSGQIPQGQYDTALRLATEHIDSLLANLMTTEKARTLFTEASRLIDQGTPAEQLPLYTESLGTEGASVMDLYNQGAGIEQQRWGQEHPQPPAFKGYAPPDVQTVTEERDYYSLVQNLGLGMEVEQYFMGKYREFWAEWMRTGRSMPFIEWIQIQMGG